MQKSIQPKRDKKPQPVHLVPTYHMKRRSKGISKKQPLTLRHDVKKLQKGSGQTSPQVPPPLPQGEFGSDMISSWSSNGAGPSDCTHLS